MEISIDWKSHLLVEYSKNKFACELLDGLIQDDKYIVTKKVIFYKYQVYLVPRSSLKKKILAAVHNSPLADHQGFFKTYMEVKERFSWKGLKKDVMKHINECVTCQQNKSGQTLPSGLLQPLPILE
jgi:uracil DNA glycosylase